MSNKKDYYNVLGIDKNASKTEIKKAYRKLAKKYHPDVNKAADAEDRFKEVKESYEVLSDDQKRAAYDKYGHAGTNGFAGGFPGAQDFSGFDASQFGDFADIGSIFDSFFGGSYKRGTGRRVERGQDIQVRVRLKFEDAVFGKEQLIQYERRVRCEKCNGSGAKNGTGMETCAHCKGRGQVTRVRRTFLGAMQTTVACPICKGVGKIIKEPCEVCSGQGFIKKLEKLKLQIPKGTPDGLVLRFRDKGHVGGNGGSYGSLYVQIEVKSHKIFERRGNDIYLEDEIDVITAVLGGEIDIPTLHGNVKIKIKAGTQPDAVVRLSDKGIPKLRGGGKGDQYVKLRVFIPKRLSKEQRSLWESLAQTKRKKRGILGGLFN